MVHKQRHRELTYLIDDITRGLNRLSDSGHMAFYDHELIAQIHQKLEILRPMQIGTIEVLDAIQYLLGEIQTGRYEDEEPFIQVGFMIDYIQDYLYWAK